MRRDRIILDMAKDYMCSHSGLLVGVIGAIEVMSDRLESILYVYVYV